MQIPLDKILPNPEQPRTILDDDEIYALADSLERNGLLNAISLEGPFKDGWYILLDGERRLRAAKILKWELIEAIVRPSQSPPEERLILALIGNLHRADMGPVDEASAFKKLKDAGMSPDEIGERLGYSASHIRNRIGLIDGDLEAEVLDLLNRRLLPLDYGMISQLRKLPREAQIAIAQRGAVNKLGAQMIRSLCSRHLNATPFQRRKAKDEHPTGPAVAPALRVHGVTLADSYADVVEQTILICEGCDGNIGTYGAICKACPLASLMKALGKKE